MLKRIISSLRVAPQSDFQQVRRTLAEQYLRGRGLEIGALHQPLPVSRSARVTYVDRMSVPDLRRQYPDLAKQKLVPVDIVDNGETLATIGDGSQDFVIANHFLEHTENPIGTLRQFFRVLAPGGVLYLALPDKRFTFDRNRPVTSYDHLERDDRDGPAGSRDDHYLEYARANHAGPTDEQTKGIARHLRDTGYSIHFHVWTQAEMFDLLLRLRSELSFDIEAARKNECEMIFVLRKAESARLAA